MASMDEEVGLPRATINKIIRDAMPSDSRLSADACDKLIECATEFVNLVSSEANDVCSTEGKSTIHPDHVVTALGKLQFTYLLPEVQQTYDAYKAEHKHGDKKASKRSGADKAGTPFSRCTLYSTLPNRLLILIIPLPSSGMIGLAGV
jgi:histone H3/H4